MAYDTQLQELRNLLPTSKSILIALPVGADLDKLAAALSLFLLLQGQGKEVSVICEDSMKVAQAHLFGIDHISSRFPQTEGGNLILSLEGVEITPDGKVPALKSLDWSPEGSNTLNLVFHVIPGQTFQPTRIVPRYQGGGFDLIFVIGAANLNSLGALYGQNQQIFSGVHLVNIDNQGNTGFGNTNIIDTNASSVSEMMASILTSLGLNPDADAATNLLAGIFEASGNLTSDKVNAETYAQVANLMKAGGKKPAQMVSAAAAVQQPSGFDLSAFIPQQPVVQKTDSSDAFTVPPVVSERVGKETEPVMTAEPVSSPEERPAGEAAITESNEIEPDWLTPKVFKGTSIG